MRRAHARLCVAAVACALAASASAASLPPTATTGTGGGSLSCSVSIPSHLGLTVPPCLPPPIPSVVASAGSFTPNRSLCSSPGPTSYSLILSATVTPVVSASDTVGSAAFVYGPTAAHGQSTPSVSVPWSSTSGTPRTVSMTITGIPLAQTTHFAVVVIGPSGETLQTGDAIPAPIPVPQCPVPLHRLVPIKVRWSLVHVSHRHHTATIRFQPPCGATKSPAHVSVTPQRHHAVQIAVTMRVPVPLGACLGLPKAQQRTIHIPRGTSRIVHAR